MDRFEKVVAAGVCLAVICFGVLIVMAIGEGKAAMRHGAALDRVRRAHSLYCPSCGERFPYDWCATAVPEIVDGESD